MSESNSNISEHIDVKSLCHKSEGIIHVLSGIISFAIYGFLTFLAYKSLTKPEANDLLVEYMADEEGIFETLIQFGPFLVIAVILVFYIIIIHRTFKNFSEAVSCDVPVSDRQYANLKAVCRDYAQKLGIKTVPELFLSEEGSTEVEVSVLTIKSKEYIRLCQYHVVLAEELEDYSVLHFSIASELAHIALGHRDIIWVILTAPVRAIPFYRRLCARIMNNSADRIAAELVGKENAIKSIIILSQALDFAGCLNQEAYLEDIQSSDTKWHVFGRKYYEMFSDVTPTADRIAAISGLDEKNS